MHVRLVKVLVDRFPWIIVYTVIFLSSSKCHFPSVGIDAWLGNLRQAVTLDYAIFIGTQNYTTSAQTYPPYSSWTFSACLKSDIYGALTKALLYNYVFLRKGTSIPDKVLVRWEFTDKPINYAWSGFRCFLAIANFPRNPWCQHWD